MGEPDTTSPAQLSQIIQLEIYNARALLATIHSEGRSLGANDLGELEQASQDKLALARDIEKLCDQRDHALRLAGLPPGPAGIARYKTEDTRVGDLWEELQILAEQCQTANHQFGTLVRKRSLSNDQALQILRTGSVDTLKLYNPRGATGGKAPSRTIGKA
jgi:flagellar biosynthesis/type III secretory pathway chaperone